MLSHGVTAQCSISGQTEERPGLGPVWENRFHLYRDSRYLLVLWLLHGWSHSRPPVNSVVMLNSVRLCKQKQLQLFQRLKYSSTHHLKDFNIILPSRFSSSLAEEWNIAHVLYKYKQVHTNVFFIQEKYFEFSWNLGKAFFKKNNWVFPVKNWFIFLNV